jgi:hypothetical protein
MRTHTRGIRWLMISAVVLIVGAASLQALSNWASDTGLATVAVSFADQVLILDNADPDDNSPIDTIPSNTTNPVAGSNGALQFDAFLNLLVTNFDANGSGKIVPLSVTAPHYPLTTPPPLPSTYPYTLPIGAPANASAIAIAADGTIYVASRATTTGGRATVWRLNPDGSFAGAFTVPADTTTCASIDLGSDQSTLYYVTGGRTVQFVTGVNAITRPKNNPLQASASPFTTLPGTGGNLAACGIRLLAPPDIRETPLPPHDLVRMVIADSKNVKFISAQPGSLAPLQTDAFDAGGGSKDWFDVAVDPVAPTGLLHVADVWAVDRASRRLAKFRLGTGGGTVVVEDLALEPRGVAVNGELRVAQNVLPVTVNTTTRQSVTFWQQNTATRVTWAGLGLGTSGATLAIQAFEVTFDAASGGSPDVNTGLCVPSLNTRCRLLTNFSEATPKIISRGRPVVLREILRSPPTNDDFRISVEYRDLTGAAGGPVCRPDVVPPTTAMARDSWEHKVFDDDAAVAFYGGDDGAGTVRKTNDTIILSRTSPAVKYNLRVVNPNNGTTIQVKRSLPISVEVTDPFANCAAVPGLTNFMIFTVTDVTTAPGTPVGDTIGFIGAQLTSNGHPFAFSANLYRTQMYVDPKLFDVNRTFRLCPQIPSNSFTLENGAVVVEQEFPAPLANEACVNFNTIK